MLNIGNEKLPLCAGHGLAAQLPARRRRGHGRAGPAESDASGSDRRRRSNRGPASSNCITIFLVGSPGHLDTWDMKPDAPAEVRGKFKPIADQRQRHPDLRALPADGPADGQDFADPQPAPSHRRDARKRPALDDDRPRFQRRQHQAALPAA